MKDIIMPKQGLQMTEGIITAWLVDEGGQVTAGEPLFEMETDKVVTQIDAPVSGVLLKILRQSGETVPVAEIIAYVGEPGESVEDVPSMEPVANMQEDTGESDAETVSKSDVLSTKSSRLASPRAKKAASDHDIDLDGIEGSGPDGVIIERDVKSAITPLAKKIAGIKGVEVSTVKGSGFHGKIVADDVRKTSVHDRVVPMSGMRKIIASRMSESLTTMAQAFHNISVDASGMIALREQLKQAGRKASYNDIIVLAVCKALKEFPEMNASVDAENIIYKEDVNVGLAVSVENGLLVPVVKQVQNLSLEDIAKTSKGLIKKAQDGELTGEELSGGTFTISNLGMFDIDSFRAIVNPPEVGILAVGKIEKKPVVIDDEICIRPIMQLCLTYDHRVVDGAPAAKFLKRLKQLLQFPMLML